MSLRIPLRIVFYKETGRWIAHCLEFDLIGDGRNKDAALRMLFRAIHTQVDAVRKYGNVKNLFGPADAKFFEMFAAGKDIAEGELTSSTEAHDPMIDSVATREYLSQEPARV
jgi:hypothetical protein